MKGTFCFEDEPLAGTKDCDWSLDDMNVLRAWQQYFDESVKAGKDILIGHPDTGYWEHPEILSNMHSRGHDFLDGDDDAKELA